jgi:signal transduction histidine kinase
MKAELPINEDLRIKALHALAILDSPREQSFDDVAQVAMQLCDVPIAVVSLVDVKRQWFKSCLGLDASETSRDLAFCAHAILNPDDVLVIEDATKDPRFFDNGLVTAAPFIRFYAGAPLIDADGFALGTLCVIDYQPRSLSPVQINMLKALARQVIHLLRLKAMNDAMQKYVARLESLEQIKNEFISTVSHELRTPLTSITGALGLISNSMLGALPEKVMGMLNIAYKNSQRLTLLINDLLDMEKLIAGKMQFDMKIFPLLPLVQQAAAENKAYADKYGVTFIIHNHIDHAAVTIDSFRLQQVLSNFLSNAAKFSPRDLPVEISLTRENDWLRISVQDHGAGIPEAFKAQMFQKFSQADSSTTRQKGGTGLGLAISKELVEHMSGRVGFDSKANEGACFYAEFKEAA